MPAESPGERELLERIVRETPDARAARRAYERWVTARRLWAAIDDAGITDDAGRAQFIAGRLWPDMPQAWAEALVARTNERALAGHHLRRPSTLEDVVGPRLAGLVRAHGFPADLD